MAKDPVCGMEVDERQAEPYQTLYEGEKYLFCSESCKTAFESNPEKYAGASRRPIPNKRKVVVVGTGQVGATFSFALLVSGLASDIVLIDRTFERAQGNVMDLNHGLSFVQPARIYAGNYND